MGTDCITCGQLGGLTGQTCGQLGGLTGQNHAYHTHFSPKCGVLSEPPRVVMESWHSEFATCQSKNMFTRSHPVFLPSSNFSELTSDFFLREFLIYLWAFFILGVGGSANRDRRFFFFFHKGERVGCPYKRGQYLWTVLKQTKIVVKLEVKGLYDVGSWRQFRG